MSDEWLSAYREHGHATLPGVFTAEEMDRALAEIEAWGAEFLKDLSEEKRAWYVDGGVATATVLRKLDNPHANRPFFRKLASHPRLVQAVEAAVGPGVSVYFSQIFMKPPRGGGPKPVHQDNFYFGPTDNEGIITAWIALDEATVENGCLHFADGTHKGPIIPHVAPEDRPFDLQVPAEVARTHRMTPAPVPKGGVSFHHGNTFHQSADNNSDKWRRACAFHFVRNDVTFANPALPYDHSLVLRITEAA